MKTFSDYIREAVDFRLGGSTNKGVQYSYFPKDRKELKELMKKLMQERGDEGNFNDIDTSNVEYMDCLFSQTHDFNGDITQWDTSSVTNMYAMFFHAKIFNQDISIWDTSKVKDMGYMFYHAEKFNQDISRWDTSKVDKTYKIFSDCPIKEEYKPKFKI